MQQHKSCCCQTKTGVLQTQCVCVCVLFKFAIVCKASICMQLRSNVGLHVSLSAWDSIPGLLPQLSIETKPLLLSRFQSVDK